MTLQDLLSELEQSEDDATVEIAAEALADGEASLAQLRDLIGHRLPAVRRASVIALGRRGQHDARGLVEERLQDPNGQVRAAACLALGALADPGGEATLIPVLDDRMAHVRAAAARALARFPVLAVVEALDRTLGKDRAPPVREAALESLGDLSRADVELRAVAGVLACHTSREHDEPLRSRAAQLLVELGQRVSFEELLDPFRRVPLSGRPVLADALEAEAPTNVLARMIRELRALPPDPEVVGRFGSDLTQRAREDRLGRAYERERELGAIRHRLSRPGPRGVILVGPSGVGKSALIHELARRLADEPVLVPLGMHEITTGEVLSGTRFLGEWQTRLKELQEALKAPRRAVWYLPDLNRLVDAGTTSHSDESFANMLAPALERGELVILGESTPEAYRRGLDRFPAISKLFWRFNVEEPDQATTKRILQRVTADMVAQHAKRGIELEVPPASLERVLELSEDYLSAMARPGKAVYLLREAVNAAVQESDEAEHTDQPDGPRRVEVPPSQILATLSALTGVPGQLLDDDVTLDLDAVSEFFGDRVLGQGEAVEAVVDLIGLIKAGLTDPARPLGVFFFVGPTGVGKTEMAKALAEFIFGSADRLVRIDLGEFKEPDSHRRLVGDPQALEPSARSGLLTAPVRERPFSVVLLDEVEKAHRNVFDLLLPLMAEGRLVDEQGRVTDFRRTIIVMTSNIGSDLREDTAIGFGADSAADASAKVQRTMEEVFRPEFLNRIGKTLVFAPLTVEVMRRLTRREVRRVLARRGIRRRNVIVETDDSVIGILLKEGFSARFGARPLKRRVEELLLKPLARALLRLGSEEAQAVVRLGVDDERIVSEVIRERVDDPADESAESPRPTARIRDPRHGRLVDLEELEQRVLDLTERVETIREVLSGQNLRQRKSTLLETTTAPDFWQNPAEARSILSEISQIEKTLELPDRLDRRLEKVTRLHEAASRRTGETRVLHDLLIRIDRVAHDVEFAHYAVHCTSAHERGDAYLLLRRVGDAGFPVDPLEHMASMYLAYGRRKGFGTQVVFEAPSRRGGLREVGLRLDGMCAFGLFAGEEGLHQWVHREASERRRYKQVLFARVSVLAPAAAPLRSGAVTRERRHIRDEPGVLLKRPKLHLVLTHQDSLVAVDGNTDGRDEAEDEALAFLAARVGRSAEPDQDPGVVRRYVLQRQPVVRDFASNLKLPLDKVVEGELDGFVLPRVLGRSAPDQAL
jgi:ATP-dependent Clp protease ATP-binding subunit ClpC